MDVFAPIQLFADWLTFNVLNINSQSHLGESLNFFIYDSVKILLLLVVINYFMAMVRYYLPVEKLRDFLSAHKWYGLDHLLASFFGIITPFCSCSSIPLFIGFVSAGIPLGVTFSFLITSPIVNEASIAIFLGLFGFKITALYVLAGVLIGVIGGWMIGVFNLEKYIAPDILAMKGNAPHLQMQRQKRAMKELLKDWWYEGMDITKSLALYVIAGVGLGAVIHGFVPQNFFAKFLATGAWWNVPLSTILAVPLYSNAIGVIPIMEALVNKGVPFGTALSFMMAIVGLSLPQAMILKKAMKWQLLATFFGIVTLGIILIGYGFNIWM